MILVEWALLTLSLQQLKNRWLTQNHRLAPKLLHSWLKSVTASSLGLPGGPVDKAPPLQCRGRRSDLWLGGGGPKITHASPCGQKIKGKLDWVYIYIYIFFKVLWAKSLGCLCSFLSCINGKNEWKDPVTGSKMRQPTISLQTGEIGLLLQRYCGEATRLIILLGIPGEVLRGE